MNEWSVSAVENLFILFKAMLIKILWSTEHDPILNLIVLNILNVLIVSNESVY